ncbi:MAG: glycosyltransferase family 2 protein [Sphingobium sp.]|nr:glycosyltransferase family 2 protein [Sphingobium sp.]
MNRLVKAIKVRRRRTARQGAARAVISQSKLFDPLWYAERYPDVIAAGRDPLDHFISHGGAEGRNPSDRFDTRWYLQRNPDVARSGMNPLLHYLEHGRDEGRSMRAVGSKSQADDDYGLKSSSKKAKGKSGEPRALPYSSDFTSIWQARPVAWRALSSHLGSSEARQATPRSNGDGGAVTWLASFIQAKQSESPQSARVALFAAMRRDCLPETDDRDTRARQHPHRLLAEHGLGFEAVADGWFSGQAQLMLRVRGVGAARLRAFQYTSVGDIVCCAETAIADSETQLVHLTLDHELCPVLLTWHADDNRLISSTLLPFPSLFRGGLHHSEMAANEIVTGKRDTVGDVMASRALEAYCWPNPDEGFAIKRIAIDLQGASGSEILFSATTIATLAAQFGVEVELLSAGRGDVLQQLDKRLRTEFRGRRMIARAKTGRTLVLPADGFPSLHCLTARNGGQQLGMSSFCIVDAETRELEALVCQPKTSAALSALHHPALPLPYPFVRDDESGLPAAGRHFGAPVMIRFRNAKVWNVDALMPLSPDIRMPTPPVAQSPGDGRRARICVIIDRPTSGDQLSLCVSSLAHQTIADDLDIALVGDENPSAVAAELFSGRIALRPASEASRAERLNRAASAATSDYLLFLDASVCLPDPRTLTLLLAMASQPQIASVSCALVREDDIDGATSVECSGYFEQWQDAPRSPAPASHTDAAQIFPASTYPVVANDMRLCLVPIGVWRDLGGLNAKTFPDSGFDVDFGLRARVGHFEHYCTTLTRAAVAKQEPASVKVDESPHPAIPRELREQMSEQVLSIRKLHR